MNKRQSIKQQRNINAVKKIIKKHKTHSTSKIQDFLLDEYSYLVTKRSIRRYLAAIKEEPKVVKPRKTRIAKVKKQVEKQDSKYPYTIKDPSGKEHKIMGDNHTITIQWGTQGLITYDKEDRVWRYDYNGKPFDKNKKSTPFYKTRNNLSWDF